MSELTKMMDKLNQDARLCHSPEIWNKIPDEQKKVILAKEEVLKVLIESFMEAGLVK